MMLLNLGSASIRIPAKGPVMHRLVSALFDLKLITISSKRSIDFLALWISVSIHMMCMY